MPGKGGDLAARLAQIIHGGKDKGRQSIDQALEEDESAATLVRLMKDDIIGQADPSLVSELYHSLRTANPGAMRDDNLARLMLRESLQYGSVPVHMYSDLTKLRGDQQDVEHDERVNENNRYGIGSRPAARAKRDEKS
jgi:hypothetical protein